MSAPPPNEVSSQTSATPLISPWWTGLLCLFAIGLGFAFVKGLERSQYSRYDGYLQAVSESVTVPRSSRISQLFVKPGDKVRPGVPLVNLMDVDLEQALVAKQREIATLEAELNRVRAQADLEIADRKAKLEAEIFQTELQFASVSRQKVLDHMSAIMESPGFPSVGNPYLNHELAEATVPPRLLPRKQSDAAARSALADARKEAKLRQLMLETPVLETEKISEAQAKICEQRLGHLKDQLGKIPDQVSEALGQKVVESKLAAAKAVLEDLNQQAKSLTLSSHAHGVVGVIGYQVGDLVAERDVVLEVFDEDQPYLIMQVPTSELSRFEPGTPVEVRFPRGEVRQGEVTEIPPQAIPLPGPREALPESAGLIRVLVGPRGQVWPKAPFGSKLEIRRPH